MRIRLELRHPTSDADERRPRLQLPETTAALFGASLAENRDSPDNRGQSDEQPLRSEPAEPGAPAAPLSAGNLGDTLKVMLAEGAALAASAAASDGALDATNGCLVASGLDRARWEAGFTRCR